MPKRMEKRGAFRAEYAYKDKERNGEPWKY